MPHLASSSVYTTIRTLVIATILLSGAYTLPKCDAAPAFFVFGDSLVDSGNNNYLVTTARADGIPYGIDYPTHRPTGRFSNGLNIPDLISEQLGAESTLPYLNPELTGEKLLVGANFASAGIGVLDDTGVQFLNIIRISRQFEFFQQYQGRLSALIGAEQAQKRVNEGIVLIVLGGNDFVNNYFLPFSARPRQYALPDFARLVVTEYRKILKRLYDLGARKVMVTGTGPLGCVPSELAQRGRNGGCDPDGQRAAAIYNPMLDQMLQSLNSEVGSDVFIGSNTGNMLIDFIDNPQAYGFVTSKVACCGQGPYNGLGTCNFASNLCPDRSVYAFWDPFHPTERANRLIVQQMMTGSTKYMTPMNLSTILALSSNT